MSLIEEMMETCILVNETKVSDGEGGWRIAYSNGPTIKAAITNDTSIQARTAESQGVTSTYTITTTRLNKLGFHWIIKRQSDGKTFRVTSEPTDKMSPGVSSLDISQVTAESWKLPNE